MIRTLYYSISIIIIFLSAVSCGRKSPKQEDSSIVWTKLPVEAMVEIARTAEERAQGLKFREYLRKDCGMYFIMEKESVQNFWMKDTRIPLSIAFMNSDNIIVSIKDMRPYDVGGTSSDQPSQYALEMQKSWFREKDIIVGDKVVLKDEKILFYRASRQNTE